MPVAVDKVLKISGAGRSWNHVLELMKIAESWLDALSSLKRMRVHRP